MLEMRILSLLPASTEIVCLLGLEKYLVGISHECDYPSKLKKIPKITSSPISNLMSSLEIEREVKRLQHSGIGVFHIDQDKLKKLKPDLILTQELCQVCAVGFNQVKNAARILEGKTKIISLEPESIADILENIKLIGQYTEREKETTIVIRWLRERLEYVKQRLPCFARNDKKPRVLIVEWLDPIMVAGHWVPEMVEMAGGKMIITKAGEKSRRINSKELSAINADIVIIAPCGFNIARTLKERQLIQTIADRIQTTKVYLLDGNSYLTRPGPRIIDGIEILAEILHPEIFPKKKSEKDWTIFN